MKILEKIRKSSYFKPLLIVILVGLLAGKGLYGTGYFNMHDDLQMMRQLEMEKCFWDLQIPCRWVPDMGYGFGFPLFNFYPPLPYLVGEILRIFGLTFVSTAKYLFVLAVVLSGMSMYVLAAEFFGIYGGMLAAVFYVWAPYHAVDVYVRGAMNETWGMVWFPLILWSSYKLIRAEEKGVKKYLITLALGWCGLLTSHNLMVLIFGPVFGLWSLIWFYNYKAWRKLPSYILVGILAFGLAAFFTIPALTENKYTHIDSVLVGYYDYSAHFANMSQILFSRFWGYGPSVWETRDDRMSFQVGHIHWVGSIILAGLLLYSYLARKRIEKEHLILGVFLFLTGWMAIFMIHSRSTPLWLTFTPFRLIQFPWRFLAYVIFSLSFLMGIVTTFVEDEKLKRNLVILLSLGLIVWNWNYFLPEHGKLGPLTDEEKFSGAAWDLQQTAGIYDYLPITAKTAPKEPQKSLATAEGNSQVKISNESQGTNWATFDINVASEKADIRIEIFDFPGWKTFIDGKEVEHFVPESEEWGRMYITVPMGVHMVSAKFSDTPVRRFSNLVSFVSWGGLLGYLIVKRKK